MKSIILILLVLSASVILIGVAGNLLAPITLRVPSEVGPNYSCSPATVEKLRPVHYGSRVAAALRVPT
jgi:hypothetical protein